MNLFEYTYRQADKNIFSSAFFSITWGFVIGVIIGGLDTKVSSFICRVFLIIFLILSIGGLIICKRKISILTKWKSRGTHIINSILLIFFCGAGFLYYSNAAGKNLTNTTEFCSDREIRVSGKVSEYSIKKNKKLVHLKVTGNSECVGKNGEIMFYLTLENRIWKGMELSLSGKTYILNDGFIFLNNVNRVYRHGCSKFAIRCMVEESKLKIKEEYLAKLFREPELSLLLGILFGVKTEFDNLLFYDMRVSGLTHIAVVSGFNVMLVFSAASILAGAISASKRYLIGIFFATMFSYYCGFDPPVTRALVMLICTVIYKNLGRKQSSLQSVSSSLLLMFLYAPLWVRSLSLWLSYIAYCSLCFISSPVFEIVSIRLSSFVNSLITTLCAYILIIPISLGMFSGVSIIAIPMSLIVLPLISDLTILGFSATILSVIVPDWMNIPALVLQTFLHLLTGFISFSARMRLSYIEISTAHGSYIIFFAYLVLIISGVYLNYLSLKRKMSKAASYE